MSSICVSTFSACFSVKEDKSRDRVSHYGVEREMNILYQQPHLVEPMKLRVYEDLPSTPLSKSSSGLPQWQIFPSRNTESRASSRARRFSLIKKKSSKPSISKPLPIPDSASDLPFRRGQQYRPLELSVYVDEDHLSGLPEFNRLSFNDLGELKRPPKALLRTLSEQTPSTEVPATIDNFKSASTSGVEHTPPTRPTTAYSIVSTSRPPSEYEALNSHPVSWSGLLGMAHFNKKVESSVDILTPMAEEFSPNAMAVLDDVAASASHDKVASYTANTLDVTSEAVRSSASVASSKDEPLQTNVDVTHSRGIGGALRPNADFHAQKRISQWLLFGTPSSSTTSVESNSTTTSFANHRRKRSEFYQLGKQPPITPASPPEPLQLAHTNDPRPQHQRTVTASTAGSSVGTEVLSFGFTARSSEDSMTTMSAADVMSRQGTVKSISSPGGLKITISQVQDLGFDLTPHFEADVFEEEEPIYLEEIGGPLRSPGVGIAF